MRFTCEVEMSSAENRPIISEALRKLSWNIYLRPKPTKTRKPRDSAPDIWNFLVYFVSHLGCRVSLSTAVFLHISSVHETKV